MSVLLKVSNISGIQRRVLICFLLFLTGSFWILSASSVFASDNQDRTSTGSQEREKLTPDLGMNVNGQYHLMKFDNVDRTGTEWVRGFLDFFHFYPDQDRLESDDRIQTLIKLSNRGYKTIVSIKWQFRNRPLPASGDSKREDYKAFFKTMLDRIWTHTDLLVIGNEPFIESRPSERGETFLSFYRDIARFVRSYRESKDHHVPIYVGAFNNLYNDSWQTDGVKALLSFVRNQSWIAGVDLHIHHSEPEQIDTFMSFVEDRIRGDQRILVTEFSLKDFFRSQMQKRIPEAFASEYGYDPEMQNFEYIDSALKEPVSREEWVQFLRRSTWFERRKDYIRDAFQRFRSFDTFYIANYALRQSYPFDRDFTKRTTPWILNGLFANRTVVSDPETGKDQKNYAWFREFRAIREDQGGGQGSNDR